MKRASSITAAILAAALLAGCTRTATTTGSTCRGSWLGGSCPAAGSEARGRYGWGMRGAGQDQRTAEAISQNLKANSELGRYNVNIQVRNGVATLSGTAESARSRDLAVSIARGTSGVRSVEDRIALQQSLSDSELRQRVLNALRSEGENLDRVNIAANNGVVTVSGTASNHRVLDRILSRILNVDGVHDVRSDVEITARA